MQESALIVLTIHHDKLRTMKKHFSLLTIFLFLMMPSFLISSCGEKDSTIQAAIESTLNENKDLSGIAASVKDGVITLTGEIKRNELQKLMMTLHTLKPKKIDNQLTIK